MNVNGHQVATTRTVRDINRRVVLNLIRMRQPISRAELALHSRLQRSTISAITEQLIAERWVTVGAAKNIPRGRKPTFLHLNGDRAATLSINIQPKETTIAVADLNLRFLAQETMATGDDPEHFVNALCRRVRHAIKSRSRLAFEGVGVALPGRVELASGRLAFAPNLGWASVDLKRSLEQAAGLPVEMENAANACALAEIWSGRYSENVRNLVAVTISEGIGVGMILNGRLVRGASGFAGEFGHVTIQEKGLWCNCGKRGCWEAYASNTAAERHFSKLASAENGKNPAAISFDAILRLAKKGDKRAGGALDRMAHYLGIGMAMLVTGLSPDAIVLVGEVTGAWERIGPIIRDTIQQRSVTELHTQILPTNPRTQPRLRGAVALVLQKHFGVPHGF